MLQPEAQLVEKAWDVDEVEGLVQTLVADLEDLSSYNSDLMAAIPIAVCVVSPAGIMVDANEALEQLTGRRVEELLGEKYGVVFADEGAAEELNREMEESSDLRGRELVLATRQGTVVPVSISAKRRVDSLGNVSWVIGLLDISESRKSQERIKDSFVNLAETVSRAVESRDPYTAGHQRRVARLAYLVGQRMDFDEDRLRGLYIGSLLHDVGKVSIPEGILNKPGRLTSEEAALVHTHAKRGHEIVDGAYFPWPVAEMALSHHERLDGSGYPDGISGEQLSLEVRILGLCDVAEAMSSFRPYRPARSKEEVVEEVKKGKGTKYDPDVADALLELIKSGELERSVQGS